MDRQTYSIQITQDYPILINFEYDFTGHLLDKLRLRGLSRTQTKKITLPKPYKQFPYL